MDSVLATLRFLSQLTKHPLTSFIGLAGAGLALWQLVKPGRKRIVQPSNASRQTHQTGVRPASETAGSGAQAKLPQQQPGALAGAKHISISAPGVLLQQTSLAELEDVASLRPDAAGLLRGVCGGASSCCVLACVESDVGRAAVTGAFEAAGLLGLGRHQLPPHRLLFCSTEDGKASMVRQLSPDVHVDASQKTVLALQRFIRRVVLVQQESSGTDFMPSVVVHPSLSAALQG